jgi:hypothetical protein
LLEYAQTPTTGAAELCCYSKGEPMTEAEWLRSTDWLSMWEFVRQNPSERKLRLFSSACCRRIWDLLTDGRSREVVVIAELFADGKASLEELDDADKAALDAYNDAGSAERDPASTALTAARTETWTVFTASEYAILAPAGKDQAAFLRCIFGPLPFRPMTMTPGILTWQDSTIPRLAQVIYEERHMPAGTLDPAGMIVLADALEEAGCTDSVILGHCRGPGDHVRGCWVVDLVLGKT